MKKLLVVLAALLMCACCSFGSPITPRNAYESVGTVNIYAHIQVKPKAKKAGGVEKREVLVSSGTIFAVAPRLLVTANHVCEFAQYLPDGELRLEYFNGKILAESATKLYILKQDFANDMCLVYSEYSILKPIKISSHAPEIGDKISIFGSPAGLFGYWTDGYLALPRQMIEISCEEESKGCVDGVRIFNFSAYSAPAYGGNSGSPIVNDKGEVIGVLVAGASYPFISFSPRYEKLIELLR
jgi:S1-C subfamily serine protease